MSKILITGIAGQTGSYLAEHLLDEGYEVHGIIRRNSTPENQENRIAHLEDRIKTYYGDVTDRASIEKVMKVVRPDIIYNLAAQSHVRISFDIPEATFQTNAAGVMNMLEAYKSIVPEARFIQASSSEMFGNSVDPDGYQRETTPMHPVSPYGCSKLAAYSLVRHYRNAYKLHACNSICFNHESPRRATNFVTNKVVKAAVRISLGLQKDLVLGNMDSFRDWGHAYDYARAIHKVVTHETADDFVISTGKTHSVRELCETVFSLLGLDYRAFVSQDEKFLRPEELKYLKGDNTKAGVILGYKPNYNFHELILDMIQYWQHYFHKEPANVLY